MDKLQYVLNMKEFTIIIGVILILGCVWVHSSMRSQRLRSRDKITLLKKVPEPKLNVTSQGKGLNKERVNNFIESLTKNNGIEDDNPKGFIRDYFYIMGMVVFMGGILYYFTSNVILLIGLFVGGLFVPIMIRKMGQKEYRKEYLKSFYKVIDYLILYTSGGVNIYNALSETEKLLVDSDVIKKSLQETISYRNVAGTGGDSYIDSLKLLNKDVQIVEIDDFVRIIELQTLRGTPITNSLYSQINYIRQKETMAIKDVISKAENQITLYKTGLCTLPILLLFLIPPMVDAFVFFS